jgi:hypothetical protein
MLALSMGQAAHAFECHTALVLALDASESVDASEARLQRTGLAFALTDPEVMEAIAPNSDYGSVALAFEWAGTDDQKIIAGWARLTDEATIRQFAERLANQPASKLNGQTAIGEAMRFAVGTFGTAPVSCIRRVIDISGDGPGNIGTSPDIYRAAGLFDGITINGLVIRQAGPLYNEQQPSRDPLPYYEAKVRQGAGSFVMVTNTYEAYGATMRRKLLRELRPSITEVLE